MVESTFEELFNDLEMGEFKPGVMFLPGLSTLELVLEDCSYTSHYVNRSIDIHRINHEDDRLVGMKIWLGYNPQLLLPHHA